MNSKRYIDINHSQISGTDKIQTHKLNTSQPLNININMNNKSKNKKRQINLYKKPLNFLNDDKSKYKNIKKNYNIKLDKSTDSSLINISNELYNSINLGRNAINMNFNNNKNPKKVKEKTPFKNMIKTQENKENFQTNITIKTKNIYKTKTNTILKNYQSIKLDKHNTNINNKNKNILCKSMNITQDNIKDISLRLFNKKTISSKNKIKKSIIYTPKKKTEENNKNIYSNLRAKTCQPSAKKMVKYLLTSQKSESRFYTKNIFPPLEKEVNNDKNFIKKKTGSIHKKIDYALANFKNLNNIEYITSINTLKNSIQLNNNKAKDINHLNEGIKISKKITKNTSKNEDLIHNYLYHNINSPLSLEIIISESKGRISTKCPLGHINDYKFSEFYSKFRAIPDLSSPLKCYKCKSFNNLNNFFCGKCNNFLCYNCIYNHEKINGHKIISIQNINTYCSFHNKKYIFFCYDCNKNCCEFCHTLKESKIHKFKTFNDILIQFKKEEKSIIFIKNEIHNQLKLLNDFIERYNEDLKNQEHYEILKSYLEEYINYFRDILKLKEKLISKYNYNQNNYYNIMNVLNLSLPLFYDYKTENLFKLSRYNDLYDKYLIINDFINFVNNNSIKIFEGNLNYKKYTSKLKNAKLLRTIKPSKIVNLNNNSTDYIDTNIYEDKNKSPKQILDLEYNGYFLLLKDKNFDIYDKDLNLVKNFSLINKFGNSFNEIIIGAKILENKNLAIYNYKRILIIQFSYDFKSYEIINEFDLKVNGKCKVFNNFGFDEDNYEIQNPLINQILDINQNEIISFGIKIEDKYLGTIWKKNKKQETQIIDINAENDNQIYNIISALKYDTNKFAILEKNNNMYYNIKIYRYEPKKDEFKKLSNINENAGQNNINYITNNDNKGSLYENKNLNGNEDTNYTNNKNKTFEEIDNNLNNTQKGFYPNRNRYEQDENNISDEDSEKNIDEIILEIKTNAEKREEEYIKYEQSQKMLNKEKEKEENEDIFIELFNLSKIKCKIYDASKEKLSLIHLNQNLFCFLDFESIIIINFETNSVVSKIDYGSNNLIYIDKTFNDNFLFKDKNKIISYHLNRDELIRINLPVFEYNNTKGKKISSWYLISGNEEFINLAKIIDNNFMICLFEFRMEKWNLNHNIN